MNLSLFRLLVLVAVAVGAGAASADSWAPPTVETTQSANHRYRVIVVPRGIKNQLAYFEDKVDGKSPAGQRKGDPQTSPIARVERLDGSGKWRMVWQRPLVNDVGPTDVLLADDASFLVTFDNWHSAGFGDDVVVIYNARGDLVRKLSLEQILPPAYVHQLPRSVSSRWWGRGHQLVENDSQIELKIVEPGQDYLAKPKFAPLRLRLADGSVVPPSGAAWAKALGRAKELEAKRVEAWQEVRRERALPISAPTSNDTHAWRHYMFEIRDRLEKEGKSMGGMVLAAPGAEPGFHREDSIAGWIEDYDPAEKYNDDFIMASPISNRLAEILVKAFGQRKHGSMKGAHLVFIGTPEEGRRVVAAGAAAGATVTSIDRTKPYPAGKPLPEEPPPFWQDMRDRF